MCPAAEIADRGPGSGSILHALLTDATKNRGVYVTDGNARTIGTSKGYEVLTGLEESELVGEHMADLVSRGYFDQSVTLHVLRERKPLTIPQRILKTGRLVVVTGNPVFCEDGSIVMVVTTVEPKDPRPAAAERVLASAARARTEAADPEGSKLFPHGGGSGYDAGDVLGLFPEFVCRSRKMSHVLAQVLRIAESDCTVLIEGESGVGKDLLARAIHRLSARRRGPFIKVNCAAIPEDLMESEMFGYERGAFTGALSAGKRGLVEAADGGTLFLDEVAELGPRLQAKLLQVLQEKQFLKLGAVAPKSVDVRFIAVSNKSLRELVREGRFRDDLYYRLSVITLSVPPLRERPEDVLPMAAAFLMRCCLKYGVRKRLDDDVLQALARYHWPGNVRELEAAIEQSVLLSRHAVISKQDLPKEVCGSKAPGASSRLSLRREIERFEAQIIDRALLEHGSTEAAARALGVHRTTLRRKMRRARAGLHGE